MLPARRVGTDSALDAALARLADGAVDRPDTPDLHITAVRRLEAAAGLVVLREEVHDLPTVASGRRRPVDAAAGDSEPLRTVIKRLNDAQH